jgi:hypothetical protein
MSADSYLKFLKHYTDLNAANNFRRAYENSWSGINRSAEVSAIRSYLLDPNVGISELNGTVAPIISNAVYDFKFAGLFCHQKPRVTRTPASITSCTGDTRSCELGDLYVVFVLLDSAGVCIYASSALFQAKLEPKLDSKSQRCLYDCDDTFEVPRYLEQRLAPPNKIREMPLASEGRARGLRYLILNPNDPVTDVRSRFSPWNNNYQQRWSTFLDGLVSGTDGIALSNGASTTRWDLISDDLLHVGIVSAAAGKARGTNLPTRVATGLFNNFSYGERTTHIYDGEGGIPTMFAIAHQKDG